MKRLIRRDITEKLADLKWQCNKCKIQSRALQINKTFYKVTGQTLTKRNVRGEEWKSLWTVGRVVTRIWEFT